METISGERRHDRRYDMELKLRYKVLRAGHVMDEGNGITCNMSRSGVQFHCERPLAEGMDVELAIDWPIRLRGRYPLELHVMGQVVRAERKSAVMRITWHEFSAAMDAEWDSASQHHLAMAM